MEWFQASHGARSAKAMEPVVVAMGRVVFVKAGAGVLRMKLTAAGRKLLKGAKSVKLEVQGSFSAGASPCVIYRIDVGGVRLIEIPIGVLNRGERILLGNIIMLSWRGRIRKQNAPSPTPCCWAQSR